LATQPCVRCWNCASSARPVCCHKPRSSGQCHRRSSLLRDDDDAKDGCWCDTRSHGGRVHEQQDRFALGVLVGSAWVSRVSTRIVPVRRRGLREYGTLPCEHSPEASTDANANTSTAVSPRRTISWPSQSRTPGRASTPCTLRTPERAASEPSAVGTTDIALSRPYTVRTTGCARSVPCSRRTAFRSASDPCAVRTIGCAFSEPHTV